MVSCDSLRVHAGCAMLAILPTHYLFAVCHAWICGRNLHSGRCQEYRILQNREYGSYSLIPSVIRSGEYLATGHSPSMGMGLAPKYHASTGIYPKKILGKYPCRNPLGEACLIHSRSHVQSQFLPGLRNYCRSAKKWRVQACQRGALVRLTGPNVDPPVWDCPAFGATTVSEAKVTRCGST